MSNTGPVGPNVPALVEPAVVQPDNIVENTYDFPGALFPDHVSTVRFEEYLRRRFEPDAEYIAGGQLVIEHSEWRQSRLPRLSWNWWLGNGDRRLHLERAGAAFVAANLAVNALLNVGNVVPLANDGVETLQHIKDSVEDYFQIGWKTLPGTTETITRETPGEAHFNTFISPAKVGSPQPDRSDIQHLVSKLKDLKDGGKIIKEIAVVGSASDEWRSKANKGLGTPDQENVDLAKARREAFMPVLQAEADAAGLDLGAIKLDFKERVLSSGELEMLDGLAHKHGFANVDSVLKVYNKTPDALPNELKVNFDMNFGEARGDMVEVTYDDKPTTEVIRHPGKDHKIDDGSPHNENKDYDRHLFPVPLLLIPMPILRRRMIERVRRQYVDIPPEMPDPEFLRLYPQAETEANELVKNAWEYSRKYQYLLRETKRIQNIYRFEYQDEDGNAQQMRALFVDHEPTQATKEMVSAMFKKFSLVQGGRLGREIDMVTIFPRENAGTGHGDPKRVGLGIDIQYEDDVTGVIIPALRLVEMQMPTEPTEDELRVLRWDMARGLTKCSQWTLSHEVAGHGSDLNDQPNLVPEIAIIDGLSIRASNNRLLNRAQADYDRSLNEERGVDTRSWWRRLLRQPFDSRLRWDIRRGTEQVSHNLEPRPETVHTDDFRLEEAVRALKDRFTTIYGRSDPAEHWAEAAAQIITGIGVPFGEEVDTLINGVQPRAGYANTYGASTAMHDLITDVWGAAWDIFDNQVQFPNEIQASRQMRHSFLKLEDDEEFAAAANAARSQPMPREDEFINILTGTRI